MSKFRKGFTLIELLVVIAIIGILSSVVLASLNTAREKGRDTKMKTELVGIRTAAELYFDTTSSSYAGLFTSDNTCASVDTTVQLYLTSINNASVSEACFSSANAYAISATLPSGTIWCVDSVGANKSVSSPATAATCPTS